MKVTLVRGAKSYRVLHSKKSSLPRRVSFDRRIDKISNNGLFMAPHLVRAQNAFKDITIHAFHHTHTHTHTHTHYKYMPYWWWIGKTTDQYATEKIWVFNFDLKEESEDECLTERGREFQSTGPMHWKDLSPRVLPPIPGTRKMWVSAGQRRERGEWRWSRRTCVFCNSPFSLTTSSAASYWGTATGDAA